MPKKNMPSKHLHDATTDLMSHCSFETIESSWAQIEDSKKKLCLQRTFMMQLTTLSSPPQAYYVLRPIKDKFDVSLPIWDRSIQLGTNCKCPKTMPSKNLHDAVDNFFQPTITMLCGSETYQRQLWCLVAHMRQVRPVGHKLKMPKKLCLQCTFMMQLTTLSSQPQPNYVFWDL